MERITATLLAEFADLGQIEQIVRASLRLALAALLGALLGFEREAKGKSAGLRTHMLVTMGAALFVMPMAQGTASAEAVSRVIQGVAAGIGFLCAGNILKGGTADRVRGLTTAAGLWMSTAIGIAVGLGHAATAVLGSFMALLVLHTFLLLEPREKPPEEPQAPAQEDG
ncbi:putative Mg(2+) transport ATPase [compost metagenome]